MKHLIDVLARNLKIFVIILKYFMLITKIEMKYEYFGG